MGIRQTLNEKPGLVSAVTGGIIVIALGFILWQSFGGRPHVVSPDQMKSFYSDDDGKTWFIDSMMKIPPFDHNGKPAYRANVYRCGTTLFVGYLERFSAAQKTSLEAAANNASGSGANPMLMMAFDEPMEVKKPGDSKWISPPTGNSPASATAYQKVFNVTCPPGNSSGQLVPVSPTDSDNGAVSQ